MKIVVTGSLGHISKPLTQALVQKKHAVTVISSTAERQNEIEAIGATAAIGTMQDLNFLTETFRGADVVYCMESLGHGFFFDQDLDIIAAVTEIGNNYQLAIQHSGVKNVIHLSSIGAHTDTGVGMLKFHYNVEQALRQLPADVSVKFMRPVGFYYNMFVFIPSIKSQGLIVQNYGGDEKEPWVSPLDIAAVIAEEVDLPFEGLKVRYIASEELSPNEVAKILGEAIGKPDLQWLEIPDEQMKDGMIKAGMSQQAASGIVEMNAGRRSGIMYEDFKKHRPVLGKTKLVDFAKEFALVYHQ